MKKISLLLIFTLFIFPLVSANSFWYENSINSNQDNFQNFSIEMISFPSNYSNQNVSSFCNYKSDKNNEFKIYQKDKPFLKCVYSIETNETFYKLNETYNNLVYFENLELEDYKLITIFDYDNTDFFNDNNEIERIYSIFKFISDYINYKTTQETLEELNISEILEEKIGVCDEYTNLFNEFMKYLGYEVKYISGYVYDNEEFQPHAWSEIKVQNKWIPMDLTFNEFGFLDSNHIILNKNINNLENKDVLVNYINSNKNITIENEKDFFFLEEETNKSNIIIDYTLESPKVLDDKYFILKIIFQNDKDYYIPLDFSLKNYKEIFYNDINFEYKKLLYSKYNNEKINNIINNSNNLSVLNNTENIYDFIDYLDNLEEKNKFSTLLSPNSKKEFNILVKNNYERNYDSMMDFELISHSSKVFFTNNTREIEVTKSIENNYLDIVDFLMTIFYNKYSSCDISFKNKIDIECDYEICFQGNCGNKIEIPYNSINYNDSIKYKSYNEEVNLESINPVKSVRIIDLETNKTYSDVANILIKGERANLKFEFDYIINPKNVFINNKLKPNLVIYENQSIIINFEYEDKIITKSIDIKILKNNEKTNINYSEILKYQYLFSIFILFIFTLIILEYKKEKINKIRITHKSFSYSIKILAVDIFNNLKKLKKTKEDVEIKKEFRKIISKLEQINNKYIEIFFNLYELDLILDQKGQNSMLKKINDLKIQIINLKKEYLLMVKVLKNNNHNIYSDMNSKVKHFDILLKFLNEKKKFLKR